MARRWPGCGEFGISRKTGYKLYDRYKECGTHGLTDRARTPYRYANRLPPAIERESLRLERQFPSWGAPKLRERLRRRRCYRAEGTALSRPSHPNDLWRYSTS
jgi:putative transposase